MYLVMNNILSNVISVLTLFLIVCLARIRAEDCGQQELAQCARPLQVLSATSELAFVTKKQELDKLCPDLHTGLRCIHSYTRRCMTSQQRHHFVRLYHGTELIVKDLCEEGAYQEEFLRHAPCMREVKVEYEICAMHYEDAVSELSKFGKSRRRHGDNQQLYQMTKEEQRDAEKRLKTVCCSFQEYLECSQHTVRRKCGLDAGRFTKKFLDTMSSSLIQLHCRRFTKESGNCHTFSSSSRLTVNLWILPLTILGCILLLTS